MNVITPEVIALQLGLPVQTVKYRMDELVDKGMLAKRTRADGTLEYIPTFAGSMFYEGMRDGTIDRQ